MAGFMLQPVFGPAMRIMPVSDTEQSRVPSQPCPRVECGRIFPSLTSKLTVTNIQVTIISTCIAYQVVAFFTAKAGTFLINLGLPASS